MSAETPKHGDLLAALADLPPRKVEKFAIALGVPKNVVEESQINNPKDIYRVKSDALDWWIRNDNASWEAVAKALETKGVDERNLAERIRSNHGLVPAKSGKSVSLFFFHATVACVLNSMGLTLFNVLFNHLSLVVGSEMVLP